MKDRRIAYSRSVARSGSVIVAALLCAATVEVAHADTVVSGAAEVSLFEQSQTQPAIATGGVLRLAHIASIPEYTAALRGYRWNRGFGLDLTLRRGEVGDDSYSSGHLGIRYDIAFSQRRMGLAGLSGRGGFYFAGRTGVLQTSASSSSGGSVVVTAADGAIPDQPQPQPSAEPTARLVASASVGTYVRFGRHIRMITELGGFRVGGRGTSATSGINLHVGLGIDL